MAGEHSIHEKEAWIPAQRHAAPSENDATMLLPVYAAHRTALVEAEPPAPAPAPVAEPARRGRARRPDALPSDERNMLIFVSALLAAGTLAIVAMASIGR